MDNNKILFVDDELNIRETLTDLLVFQNYEVKTAANGQEALDILEYWIPDLILCDIMMPIMDGSQLHRIINEHHSLSAIPFVFLTAKKAKNLKINCLVSGVDSFLTKPFKISDLSAIIKGKIDRFERIKGVYNNIYVGVENHFMQEINTPLNGILGSIDVLIKNEDTLKKNEIGLFYDTIQVSGERLNRTMRNLVLYQKFKDNNLGFDATSKAEIDECVLTVKDKLFKMHANIEKRISFIIDKASIKMNELYLNFILFELIDNALKFSANSKIVYVLGKEYNSLYYELVIKDFGRGFSEEELKRIRGDQQFNRGENDQQGLGLGLFLSKIIIKKSGGVFTILSNPNEGTCIKIFLPLIIVES